MRYLFVLSFLSIFVLFMPPRIVAAPSLPKEEVFEAKVIEVLDEKMVRSVDSTVHLPYQKLRLVALDGSLQGSEIEIENGIQGEVNTPRYRQGDKVLVTRTSGHQIADQFFITDFVRRDGLSLLFFIFLFLAIIIAKKRGLLSIVSLVISFAVIFNFVLPKISSGGNPVFVAILGSTIIVPVTFFLSHGFNRKTLIAATGALLAFVITGLLAHLFVGLTNLTGFSSEEAGFLQVAKRGSLDIKSLLLAGIIIGTLGVLDDITISQSAVVFRLRQANPKLKFIQLYRLAMDVGQDHISSMINTLVLVYTGASLPLLLLFVDNPRPFSEVINYEIIADEIVRTLVGSIGLILAVPITTVLAAFYASVPSRSSSLLE